MLCTRNTSGVFLSWTAGVQRLDSSNPASNQPNPNNLRFVNLQNRDTHEALLEVPWLTQKVSLLGNSYLPWFRNMMDVCLNIESWESWAAQKKTFTSSDPYAVARSRRYITTLITSVSIRWELFIDPLRLLSTLVSDISVTCRTFIHKHPKI